MSDAKIISRRGFLKLSGTGGVAAAATLIPIRPAQAETGSAALTRATLPYPVKPIASAEKFSADTPMQFSYPDDASPCTAIKLGHPVPGGAGPERDIVAYSNMCTHMGCPTVFDNKTKTFKCPCHFSEFDAEKAGQMICGQATENLPRILLRYDANTRAISAVGVDGLLYGRQANLL